MRKVLEMGTIGATKLIYLCDRMTCTNTFTELNPHVKIGMWNPDLCPDCIAELRTWIGDLPWRHTDIVPGQILSGDPLPRAIEYVAAISDVLVKTDRSRREAERKLEEVNEALDELRDAASEDEAAWTTTDSATDQTGGPSGDT